MTDEVKRPRISKNTYDTETGVGTVEYKNGSKVSFDVARLPQAMLYQMAARGVFSVVRSEANGEAEDEARADVASRTVAALLDGSWTVSAPGGGPGREAGPSDLEIAMSQHFDKPLDWVRNHYMPRYLASNQKTDRAGRTRGAAAAIRKLETHPQIAPLLAKIVASKGRANKADALDLTQFAA